ncbi:amidase [Poseidonocella sedimentorum]|nr:amidase [Poseidonocella sedimentorum]
MSNLLQLTALELRDRMASGALSAAELAEAVIARVEAREAEVGAWAWFDAAYLREQAKRLDAHRISGRPIGPLHGLPVGLKDIIDTARIPTENGAAQDRGRVPERDAEIVRRLRAAGAIIAGKTVTTELAFMHPGKTRNPHAPTHTPGGSSQGSAAAVADGMVPLAVGTQTGGSVIRPASFCGVTGFKPSFGVVPRSGVLTQSPSLDTIGVFAADPLSAAMLTDVLAGGDPADPGSVDAPAPRLAATASEAPPLKPVFAMLRMPGWERVSEDMSAALGELSEALGDQAFSAELPAPFEAAAEVREQINFAEMAHHYAGYDPAHLSDETRAALETGQAVMASRYLAALDWKSRITGALDEIFLRCDAIICPSSPGAAPEGLGQTGDPVFNGLWTMAGTPAVSLPVLTSSGGLPMGLQLVGRRGNDGRLLRTARWLYDWIGGEGDSA